jgi:hypothetical protein
MLTGGETVRKPKTKSKKLTRYVAVIASTGGVEIGLTRSNRNTHGDWSCFTGTDRAAVVQQAMDARSDWTKGSYGPYRILVGTLTEEIVTPTNYKVVKL